MAYYLLFLGICLSVLSGCLLPFDNSILIFAEQQRNPLLNSIAIILSKTGGMPAMLLLFSVCALFFIFKKKSLTFLCIGTLGTIAIGWILKFFVDRPRPSVVSHLVSSYGASFPSAHSMYAASLACLTLYLIRNLSPSLRLFLTVFLGVWACVMGISRVYLGVHYPSDVLAGWGLSCIWISFLWIRKI